MIQQKIKRMPPGIVAVGAMSVMLGFIVDANESITARLCGMTLMMFGVAMIGLGLLRMR